MATEHIQDNFWQESEGKSLLFILQIWLVVFNPHGITTAQEVLIRGEWEAHGPADPPFKIDQQDLLIQGHALCYLR